MEVTQRRVGTCEVYGIYLTRSHPALSQGLAPCYLKLNATAWYLFACGTRRARSTLPGKQLNSLLGYLGRPGARELRGGRAPNGGGEGPDQRQVPRRLRTGLVLDQ